MPHYVITEGWAAVYRQVDLLTPYIKNDQIWYCPSNSTVAYAYHRCNFGRIHVPAASICSKPLANQQEPARTVAFFEATAYPICSDITFGPSWTCIGPAQPKRVHNGGLNISFMDGHVKWYSYEAMRANIANGSFVTIIPL